MRNFPLTTAIKKAGQSFGGQTRAFIESKCGTGAIEFAMIVPFMLLYFFGTMEAGELWSVDRRMKTSANQLVDLVAQARDDDDNARISAGDIDLLINNIQNTLGVPDLEDVSVSLISVVRDPQNKDSVAVHWSRNDRGEVPYEVGGVYNGVDVPQKVQCGTSVLIVEMSYTYSQTVTEFVFQRPFTFNQQARRWPRNGFHLQMCADTTDEATCTDVPDTPDDCDNDFPEA